MKTVSSQDNASNTNTEVKTAELVLLLDGLRIDPAILAQSHEALGESNSNNSRSPLSDGIRARIRLRNNTENQRSVVHLRNLRVSI